ncbi:uncharacterized protein EDB91DRAFT_392580 [Suillus paluster]|uniref:uncharacterized protein n=1 Tax=Suillus paluster TaxID=48578 RepID=UPI001B86E5E4|nr:uncharacterized protein EDB91DRAFT_392580 [Suillus paluster]KAG1739125.1 hypothetical protein EDB91DRAFT_392580 [Suillus paluster]
MSRTFGSNIHVRITSSFCIISFFSSAVPAGPRDSYTHAARTIPDHTVFYCSKPRPPASSLPSRGCRIATDYLYALSQCSFILPTTNAF